MKVFEVLKYNSCKESLGLDINDPYQNSESNELAELEFRYDSNSIATLYSYELDMMISDSLEKDLIPMIPEEISDLLSRLSDLGVEVTVQRLS
jgi:hypothetical protein